VQWKAVFHSADSRSPVLREVSVPYLPKNQAPTVTDLKVTSRGSTGSSGQPGNTTAPSSARVTGYAASLHSPAQRGFDISWQGSDPDQDELTYNLYFRGEGESEWKLLQGDLKQNYFQLDSDALPDGRYRLKVVATDAAVNPAGMARTSEIVSAPFTVDNAPPQVQILENRRSAGAAVIRFRATDANSVLTRAEYVLDAEAPVPLLSEDGIIDSLDESFTITLNQLDNREHLITLRVYDASGNMGIGKALWAPSEPVQGGKK